MRKLLLVIIWIHFLAHLKNVMKLAANAIKEEMQQIIIAQNVNLV